MTNDELVELDTLRAYQNEREALDKRRKSLPQGPERHALWLQLKATPDRSSRLWELGAQQERERMAPKIAAFIEDLRPVYQKHGLYIGVDYSDECVVYEVDLDAPMPVAEQIEGALGGLFCSYD